MKRWLFLGGVLLLSAGALVMAELRQADAPVSTRALLNFIADLQREVSRVPMRVTRLPDAEEIRIGNQIAQDFPQRPGRRYEERAAYVRKVGESLSIRARRKLPYQFHYIPGPDFVNAFALPGGHVFIGEGLLALMRSEDEMAAVLGHEIMHIDLYHCAERAQVEARLRKIPLGGLVALPVFVFQAGYSKAQELESDREGVRLAVRAGYSPYGAIALFETMERLRKEYGEEEQPQRARTPQQELSQVARETLRGYFRSHPLPVERSAQIRTLIAQSDWKTLTEQRPIQPFRYTPPQPAAPRRIERER
jgi:predicted Zn-dependent protease